MKWTTEITNKGAELIAQAVASGDMVFTKAVGSSTLSGAVDLKTVTEMSQPQYELKLKSIEAAGNSTRLTVRLLNDGVDEAYTIRQVGIYGKLKDDPEETLISISENSIGETVPSTTTIPEWVCDLAIVLNMDNTIKPTINIPSGVYANAVHTHSTADLNDFTEISGKNLLDNPDFKINQRGQEEYTSEGYTLDRWRLISSSSTSTNGSITVLNDGIRLTSGGTRLDTYLRQYIENGADLIGKTVTASFEVSDLSGSIIIMQFSGTKSKKITQDGIHSFSFKWEDVSAISTYYAIQIYNNTADASCVIKWVKLEVGPVATPFVAPNHTEELIKIQNKNDDGSSKLSKDVRILNNSMISGKNLLDNPDFKINQRGNTSGTNSSSSYKYFVDRWKYCGSFEINENNITMSAQGSSYGYGIFLQALPIYANDNDIFTMSIWVDGKRKSISSKISESNPPAIFIDDIGKVTVIKDNGYINFEIIVLEGKSLAVEKVKLEQGAIATPFIAPNPAEELLKIQSMNGDGNSTLITGEKIPTIMNSLMISNPNLLDNPDFKINQRGLTEYIDTGISSSTVDRWKTQNLYKIKPIPSGIRITPKQEISANSFALVQDYYCDTSIYGKDVVFTVNSSVTNEYAYICIYAYDNQNTIIKSADKTAIALGYNSTVLKSIPDNAYYIRVQIGMNSGADSTSIVELNWAKLEVGSTSTKFVAPNPADELIKIQSMDDNGIPTLISNGTLPTMMNSQMVSNPNLVDNPDFRINQRGLYDYTAGYCVDRWVISDNMKVTVENNGSVAFNVVDTSKSAKIIQYTNLEFSKLAGKTLTISTGLSSGEVYSTTGIVSETEYKSTTRIFGNNVPINTFNCNVGISYSTNNKRYFIDIFIPANSVNVVGNIEWVKLEVGTVATAFVAPNPIDELIKIQSMNDDGTIKLVTNGTLPTIMNSQMMSNPNLLDNPDFKINQRGIQSNSSSGTAYTIDRWCCSNANFTISDEGNITLSAFNSDNSMEFFQRLPYSFKELAGKSLTMSVKCKDNPVYYATGTVANDEYTKTTHIIVGSIETAGAFFRFSYTAVYKMYYASLAIAEKTGGIIDNLEWVKLEIGSFATQFVAPNPTDELLKIQSTTDEGKMKLISNDCMPTNINSQMISNDNILDNPDFKINQRGVTDVTAETPGKYFIDRWLAFKSSAVSTIGGTITPSDDGLKILSNGTRLDTYLLQWIERGTIPEGTTVTLSCEISEITGKLSFGQYGGSGHIYVEKPGIFSLTIQWKTAVKDGIIFYNTSEELSCTIKWVKLEFGSVATAFTAPNPATELLKCQRYFIRLAPETGTTTHIAFAMGENSTSANAVIPVPTKMRTLATASVSMGGHVLLLTGSGDTEVTAITINNYAKNSIYLNLKTDGGSSSADQISAGSMYGVRLVSGYIDLDADL